MTDVPGSADRPGTTSGAPTPHPGTGKGPAAFRTISEASAEIGVPQHVLRFWETRFAFIRPTKRAGGRRFYRPQDLEVLRGVRVLLQDEGYTIRGVQKLHKEQGLRRLLAAVDAGAAATDLDDEAPEEASLDDVQEVGAPPPRAAVAATEPDDEPLTGDLFDDAPVTPPTPPLAPPTPSTARPVLDAAARARLSDVLDDLEATKAQIDTLLSA